MTIFGLGVRFGLVLCVLPYVFALFPVGDMAEAASRSGSAVTLVPPVASPGTTVVLRGPKFGAFQTAQLNQVRFNGVSALVQRWDPDRIEVRVPSRATSGPVHVVVGKKTVAAGTFTVQTPVIAAVEPAQAEPGTTIRIVGRGFGPTAGSKDPNVMFGVNHVLVGGAMVRSEHWRDDLIEVQVPATAASGEVIVQLASSDPLPDGSCCAPVQYVASNAGAVRVIPSIRVDPMAGPVGTKVVVFGQGFGTKASSEHAMLFNGHPGAIAQWTDTMIVTHVPLGATSGPLVLKRGETSRTIGTFAVQVPVVTALSPTQAPVGSLVRVKGQHFGSYSESGSTPFAFADFDKGENAVEFGGVPGIIYRWHDDKIDVWVPYSAQSGPIVVRRGGHRPHPDGSCCAERGTIDTVAGTFTLVEPRVESVSPTSAGLDEIITIRGSGFGAFLKTAEATQLGLNEAGHDFLPIDLRENVSRTEVLFNNIGALVVSWTDTEIQARVPRRLLFGIGQREAFHPDLATGPLTIRRGSWDLLPDGRCCTAKRWVTADAGEFTILRTGLPDQRFFTDQYFGASAGQ
ncbi:IPT/TIG domain-containing protein [Candidatus Nitrospira bockiana]